MSSEDVGQSELVAALLTRLLGDADFRTRFQRDPAAACRAHGLPDLADELSGPGAMRTLDERESKSSLAGVVMAAAFEGVSAYEFLDRYGGAMASDVVGAVDRALTLSHLEALRGGLAADPPAAAAPAAAAPAPAEAPAAPGIDISPPEPDVESGAEADAGAGAPTEDAGGGGATVKELLNDPNLQLDSAARADLDAGVVDPRLVSVLDRLTDEHEIGLSVIKTGHDKFTSSGYVSNHFHGRGLDISTVDGQPVSPGNVAAREVATLLAALPEKVRPTEVGTPFPISAPGFFTDGAHQDHIHVAFDDEAPAGAAAQIAEAAPERAAEGAGGEGREAVVARGAARQDSVAFIAAVGGREEEAVMADSAAEPRMGSGFDLDAAGADYPGDDAGQKAIAEWMGRHAQAAGLPAELPVMAALVESNLVNVDYGDADSLGFFQMRTSIWNTGEYAGYPEKPELQLKWFIDTALAAKAQQAATDDPSAYGEWVADVERPAEQYRYRYQEQLEAAQNLLKGSAPAAEASGGEAVRVATGPARDSVQFQVDAGAEVMEGSGGAAGPSGGAAEMLRWLRQQVGTPEGSALQQKWASSLGLSADLPWCSIFVAYQLRELGVPLPDNPAYSGAWLDWSGGKSVDESDLRPGDLVIYDYGDGGITDHVAVYVGKDKVIGGNQSDMVSELPLNRSYLVGVVRPKYR